MPINPSSARSHLDTLTSNLQRVQAGKAYGIDKDGALIGEALKSSFRGKVVDRLVARGIAKQGNLGGRIAAVLVGRQNFDLIRNAHADPTHRGSIANALALIEKYELAGVDDAGLDHDIGSLVRSTIASSVSMRTPLRALAGRRVALLHDTIWKDVVPQRLAWRAELADDITHGRPPKSIAKAGQVALEGAARSILAGRTEPGKLDVARHASGGQGNFVAQAENIVADYNNAVLAVRGSVAEGEDADAKVAEFRDQFIEVIAGRYEELDVTDGTGPRIDGSVSRPVKSDHAAGELKGGVTPFRPQARVGAEREDVAFRPGDRSVTFAGGREERDDYIGAERTTTSYMLDSAREALAGTHGGAPDAGELAGIAKELGHVLGDRRASVEDKKGAAELLSDPVFHDSFENVALALRMVDRAAVRNSEIGQAFADRVDLVQLRGVVEKELAFVNDVDAHPEHHEDLIAGYREAFGDDSPGEIAVLISQTRRSAKLALFSLEVLGRAS